MLISTIFVYMKLKNKILGHGRNALGIYWSARAIWLSGAQIPAIKGCFLGQNPESTRTVVTESHFPMSARFVGPGSSGD